MRLALILVVFPVVLVYVVPLFDFVGSAYAGGRSGWLAFWLTGAVLEWLTLLAVLITFAHPTSALRNTAFGDGISRARLVTLMALLGGGVLLAVAGAGGEQEFLSRMPEGARLFIPPPDRVSRLFWVVVAVTAALCEEVLWRGIAYRDLRSLGVSSVVAVAVASLGFAFFHGGLAQGALLFGYRLGIGVLLAAIYLRSGSLWPAMIVHYLMDISSLAAIQVV